MEDILAKLTLGKMLAEREMDQEEIIAWVLELKFQRDICPVVSTEFFLMLLVLLLVWDLDYLLGR